MPSSDACRDVRAATRQADGIRGKIANDAVVLISSLLIALMIALLGLFFAFDGLSSLRQRRRT